MKCGIWKIGNIVTMERKTEVNCLIRFLMREHESDSTRVKPVIIDYIPNRTRAVVTVDSLDRSFDHVSFSIRS